MSKDPAQRILELEEMVARQQAQAAASAKVLRAIKTSLGDVQPVFEIIAQCATDLCEANLCMVWRFEGNKVHYCASYGFPEEFTKSYSAEYPQDLEDGNSVINQVFGKRKIVRVEDAFSEDYIDHLTARKFDYRQMVGIPIFNEDTLWGAIVVGWPDGAAPSETDVGMLQSFADQSGIALANASLLFETQEALTQQAATSDILRVISQSHTDVQPVFDTIVCAAARLMNCFLVVLHRTDGAYYWPMASAETGGVLTTEELRRRVLKSADALRPDGNAMYRVDPDANYPSQAIVTKSMRHMPDAQLAPFTEHEVRRRAAIGIRASLNLPLVRNGDCVGLLTLAHNEPHTFTKAEIALAESFRDQAMIAFENTQQFMETQEALDQQTATADVLKVISQSAFDLPTVLQTVIETAARLCEASICILFNKIDGEMHMGANFGCSDEMIAFHTDNPNRIDRSNVAGRAVLDRKTIHVPNISQDKEYKLQRSAELGGWRSIIAVPVIRDGEVEAVLALARPDTGKFSNRHIELVETFADQAAIAINNATLFSDVQASLVRESANAEILSVINDSATNIQPVFDLIVQKSAQLCGAKFCVLDRFDGAQYHFCAQHGFPEAALEALLSDYPVIDSKGHVAARVVDSGQVVHIADAQAGDYFSPKQAKNVGWHRMMGVPIKVDGQVWGAIVLGFPGTLEPAPSDVELVQSFANQASIAIENARLLRETQERLEREQATSEILEVISQSRDDELPVFQSVIENAARLCNAQIAFLALADPERKRVKVPADFGTRSEFSDLLRDFDEPISRTELIAIGPIVDGQVVRQDDIANDPLYTEMRDPKRVQMVEVEGARSVLAVPIKKDRLGIGVIVLYRREVSPFSADDVSLVETFAAQAVIAIENVHQFRALQSQLEREAASSEILSVISQSREDDDQVFDAVLEQASTICGAHQASLILVSPSGTHAYLAAHRGHEQTLVATGQEWPLDSSLTAMIVIRNGEVAHIKDYKDTELYRSGDPVAVSMVDVEGVRSRVVVPLMQDGHAIGAIAVSRREVRPFAVSEIQLIEGFAKHAVIAIENTRQFTETQSALARQTATSNILRVINGALDDTQPVIDEIVKTAVEISKARYCMLLQIQDGQSLFRASHGYGQDELDKSDAMAPIALNENTIAGQVAKTGAVYNLPDATDPSYHDHELASRMGVGQAMGVPIIVGKTVWGVISLGWAQGYVPPPADVELISIFADQASIAIENARLIHETKEALDYQTSTTEVLHVISSSPNELLPVLDAILREASRICQSQDAYFAMLNPEDGLYHIPSVLTNDAA